MPVTWFPGMVLPLPKTPAAVKDYVFDLRSKTNGRGGKDWLPPGDTISSHSLTVSPVGVGSLVVDSSALIDSNTAVAAWLAGGVKGVRYAVMLHFTTAGGRTDEKTVYIDVGDN